VVEGTGEKGEGGRKSVGVRNQGARCPQSKYLRCSNELERRTISAELPALPFSLGVLGHIRFSDSKGTG